jgi:hypothetical protein
MRFRLNGQPRLHRPPRHRHADRSGDPIDATGLPAAPLGSSDFQWAEHDRDGNPLGTSRTRSPPVPSLGLPADPPATRGTTSEAEQPVQTTHTAGQPRAASSTAGQVIDQHHNQDAQDRRHSSSVARLILLLALDGKWLAGRGSGLARRSISRWRTTRVSVDHGAHRPSLNGAPGVFGSPAEEAGIRTVTSWSRSMARVDADHDLASRVLPHAGDTVSCRWCAMRDHGDQHATDAAGEPQAPAARAGDGHLN